MRTDVIDMPPRGPRESRATLLMRRLELAVLENAAGYQGRNTLPSHRRAPAGHGA